MPSDQSDLRNNPVALRARLVHWRLWTLPKPAIVCVLSVFWIMVAALSTSAAVPSRRDVIAFAVLVVLSVGFTESCDRTERLRKFLKASVWSDSLSVWICAGIITLRPALSGIFVLVIYAHAILVERRHTPPVLFKQVYTASAVALSAWFSSAIFHLWTADSLGAGYSALAAAVALSVHCLFCLGLIMLVVWLSSGRPPVRTLLPPRDQVTFEVTTSLLGAMTGVLIDRAVWFVLAVPVILAVLQRSALVQQLQQEAQTDGKTGLLTANAWRDRAVATLRTCGRRGQTSAVLVVDLDHFKAINDQHGHLAGDRVLVEVAACLRRSVRGADTVGRFGGEEFVVALPDTTPVAAVLAADRIRDAVRGLDIDGIVVTASIGVACARPGSDDLDGLLGAADRALYVAKSEGRDATRTTA